VVQLVVVIGLFSFFFSKAANGFLAARQTIAVQTRVAVETILVVAFFVVDCGTVVRATVDAGPVFAADVAKGVATIASTCS
jgi:hypothetical protein